MSPLKHLKCATRGNEAGELAEVIFSLYKLFMRHAALSQAGNPVITFIPKVQDGLIAEIWFLALNPANNLPISWPPRSIVFVIFLRKVPEKRLEIADLVPFEWLPGANIIDHGYILYQKTQYIALNIYQIYEIAPILFFYW